MNPHMNLVVFVFLFALTYTRINEKSIYTTIAIDCSAYGEYMIVSPHAIEKWPNTIGKYD